MKVRRLPLIALCFSSLLLPSTALAAPPLQTRAIRSAIRSAKLNNVTTQLRLNGRSTPISWNQVGDRVFLSEIALTQLFGIQLLSTKDPTVQPIAWFTNPAQAIAQLPVRIVGVERHFDITDLAKRAGWAVQIQGQELQLATPQVKTQSIQITKQPWGDRLEITLDGPVPYEWDAQSQEFSLAFPASTDPTITQPLEFIPPPATIPPATIPPATIPPATIPPIMPLVTVPNPYSRIKSLQVVNEPDRTTIKLGIPINLRPQITSLANPLRLVIDIGNPTLPDRTIAWTPGLQWRQQIINGFPVNWLEIDPKQSGLQIQPILPNNGINGRELMGTAILLQTAQQSGAIAAINGGFFNRTNLLPLGAIQIDKTWRSGPILSRGVVAWNPNGDFKFDRLISQEAVTVSPQRFPLTHLNSAYLQAGIARYTPTWGLNYTTMTDGEVIATVQTDRVIDQTTAPKPGTVIPIPANSYLLVFRSNKTAAVKFPIGTPVQLESQITPDVSNYQQVIGGGPLLIKDGQIVLDASSEQFSPTFVKELAARSAIGQTATGKILIVAAQNTPDSKGPTLSEIAQIMQQLGAVNALNLDGGSSTTLYLGGQIVDRAPRSSARVHNAIGIFLRP